MSISPPVKIEIPFADAGSKAAIPASADNINGRAGYDLGFPPVTFVPKVAGGIPPWGEDFNGIFFEITQALQFLEAGGSFPYDSAWAAAVGGYPIGALVSRTDNQGLWRNTVANNTTDPEAGGAGWQPEGSGATTIVMSSSNVTLTALQAAKGIIIITGTLTANLQLIFPGYVKQWLVVNGATGSFTVTAKTASGAGVIIPTAVSAQIYGNGTDIFSAQAGIASTDGIAGAASNLKLSASGTAATVSITADSVCLKNLGNQQVVVNSISLTPSLAASGANGLDAGVSAANTWYSIWVIWNGATAAGLFSLSATSPVLPSGYTHKARIGWARTDGTVNKYPLAFTQYNRKVQYKIASGTNLTAHPLMASGTAGNVSAAASMVAVAVSQFVPPTAAEISVTIANPSNASCVVIVGQSNTFAEYNSLTNPPPAGISGLAGLVLSPSKTSLALESSNIFWASSNASGRLFALGWEDNL